MARGNSGRCGGIIGRTGRNVDGGGCAVSERHLYLEMHGSKRRTDVCVGCAVINNGKQNKTPRRFSGGFSFGGVK